MDILNCIAELLMHHDCVIIPDFGGFIGSYSPAKIDPVNHRFIPPGKKFLFNINLKQNDGFLVNTIVRFTNCSYDQALEQVMAFVAELRRTTGSVKGFSIPMVGRLYTGREGNLQFEQDFNSNLLPDSYGLMSFIAPPIERKKVSVRLERKIQETPSFETNHRVNILKPLKWAAIIAVPLGTATIFGILHYPKFTSQPLNNAGILSSVFSRFSSASLVEKKEAPVVPRQSDFIFESAPSLFDQAAEAGAVVEDFPDAMPQSEITTTNEVASETDAAQDKPYVIIIGAFRIAENADKAVAQAAEKSIHAWLYDRSRSGLYRVAAGSFHTIEEAENALTDIQSGEYPSAWLLKQ